MTSTNTSGQTSIWTAILSSSVVLAALTGLFYFLGGAEYIGYSQVLGLNYLAGLQPAEHVFTGAELMTVSLLFIVGSALAGIAAAIVQWIRARRANRSHIPREWEFGAFVLLTEVPTIFLLVLSARTLGSGRDLITSGACPIAGHGSMTWAWLAIWAVVAFVAVVSGFFFPGIVRYAFLVWGMVACVLCLYNFGWAAGAEHLYGKFQTAKIMSPTAQLPAETDVLLLGRDDKNLVVLVSGEDSAGHPEPRYLLRSELKIFRLVGESSIDAFFCKKAVKSPAPH